MTPKLISTIVLLFTYVLVSAQKEASIWYFGGNAGIDFKTGTPVALTDGQIITDEGCATISDENGALLFYTDGLNVWDKNHSIMPNGTDLKGDSSSSQSAIIVPNPTNFNQFYIFTVRAISHRGGLHYSVVDLSLNGNKGDVIRSQKNVKLLTRSAEKIAAIEADEDGFWVLSYSGYTGEESTYDTFHAYKINEQGVNPPVKTTFASCATTDGRGYLKISADATKVMLCNQNQKHVCLHNFDVETGLLNGSTSLNANRPVYCAEFSSSSEKVYVSTGSLFNSTSILYQFDLKSSDIQGSREEIHREYSRRAALQLAIDGKIYYARPNKTYVGVINNPEESGAACGYVNEGVDLKGKYCNQGLPPFIQSYLLAGIKAEDTCQGNAVEFSFDSSVAVDTVVWNFGDGNFSTEKNPSHIYDFPGVYNVSTYIIAGTSSRVLNKEVKIIPTPKTSLTRDYFLCDDASLDEIEVFNLASKNQEVLGELSNEDYEVTYHASVKDAINHANILPELYSNTTNNQEIVAKLFSPDYIECYDLTRFSLIVEEPSIANSVENIIICDDAANDGSEIIDLSQFDASVLDNQIASNFTVTYHLSQNEADLGLNALPTNFQVITNQLIYVRIENNNLTCYDTTRFEITIGDYLAINEPTDFNLCDDSSNDGLASFDLSIKAQEILEGLFNVGYQVYFYANMQDAMSDTNILPVQYENVQNNQEIVAKVFNSKQSNCFKAVRFSLNVITPAVANSVENHNVCDDSSNDGVEIIDLFQFNTSVLNTQTASNYTITYHLTQEDANNGVGALPQNFQTESNSQLVYVRIESNTISSCYDTTYFEITVSEFIKIDQIDSLYACDDASNDGIETFDLTLQDAVILNGITGNYDVSYYQSKADAITNSNRINDLYDNIERTQEVFFKIQNLDNINCYNIGSFFIEVIAYDDLKMKSIWNICASNPITLTADAGFDEYLWSTGETTQAIQVDRPGNYEIIVTKYHATNQDTYCMYSKTVEVKATEMATMINIEVQDWSQNNNGFIVTTDVEGDYEYSLDGIVYQDSNVFKNLTIGEYNVFLREKNGCGIINKTVFALFYPKFFTPNGDSYHDYWQLYFSKSEPNIEILIFDRFGKLILKLDPTSKGWDGTLNGTPLPSSDYWFAVNRPNNSKQYKGHFTLKR